jgi:hypothetical protein
MAGILCNSSSQTMVSGDTSPDKSVTGYARNERITLTTYPTGTTYSWSLTLPASSSTAALTDDTDAAPSFVPDTAGTYLVSVDVDGTTYVIRIGVLAVSVSTPTETIHFEPMADAQVPAPSMGLNVFYSTTQGALASKNPAGAVAPLDTGNPTVITFTESATEPPNTEGTLYWYNGELCIGTGINDVRGQPMYEQWAPQCRNNTGAIIPNGTVCYVSGSLGNKPTVGLARNADDTSQKTIGLATHDIPINSSTGHITTHGTVRGINTIAWTEGTLVYMGATPGTLTSTRPTGTARVIEIGLVTKQSTTEGEICVCIRKMQPVVVPFGLLEAHPLVNSATYQNLEMWSWDDMTFAVVSGQTPNTDLTTEAYRDTGHMLAFVRHDQNNSMHVVLEMSHHWAQTDVLLHLHVIPMAAGSGNVIYGGRYFFGSITDVTPAASGWTTIAKTDPLVSGDQYKGRMVSLATCAPPAAVSHSSILSAHIYRDGLSLSDTYTTSKDHGTAAANLAIVAVDVHYQRLLAGSVEETTGSAISNPSRMYFDKSWISGTPEVFILARSTNGNPVTFRLYDVTGGVAVGATMTTSSTTYVMLSTGSLAALGSGIRELRVQAKYDAGADEPMLGASMILVR